MNAIQLDVCPHCGMEYKLLHTKIHFRFYWRYANRTHARLRTPKLYRLQVASHIILALIPALTCVLRNAIYGEPIYGFQVLDLVMSLLTWPILLGVVYCERNFLLPVPPGTGHGAVLIFTWTLSFIFKVHKGSLP